MHKLLGKGEDKRAESLEPGFVPVYVRKRQRLAGTRNPLTFCLDWDCGHRRHMHKGDTGYCQHPGCGCMGFIENEQQAQHFRRNEHAPAVQPKP